MNRIRLLFFFLMLFTCLVAALNAQDNLDVGMAIAPGGQISRQSREILDVLYPGSYPPAEAVKLVRSSVLAMVLENVRKLLIRGDAGKAGTLLASSVSGVPWKYSFLELLQALDRYHPPRKQRLPGLAKCFAGMNNLTVDYREARATPIRRLLDNDGVPTFSQLYNWVLGGDKVLSRFLGDRKKEILPWFVLSGSSSADLSALLRGAAAVEQSAGSGDLLSEHRALSRAYFREHLELSSVFKEFLRIDNKLKQRFSSFLKRNKFVIRVSVRSLRTSEPVSGLNVTFADGRLGSAISDSSGNIVHEVNLQKLVRRIGGDGWAPLAVLRERTELLYTNLNINNMLEHAKSSSSAFVAQALVYSVQLSALDLRVKVLCPVPDGPLGKLCSVNVKLSGRQALKTRIGEQVEFERILPGTYLLSCEGKDEEGVIIKTAARVLEISPGQSGIREVELCLPGSLTVIPSGEADVNKLIKAMTTNKDRLLNNDLEVKEYRFAQGEIFKRNRYAAGVEFKKAMRALTNMSRGLHYKSIALAVNKRVETIRQAFREIFENLPEKLQSRIEGQNDDYQSVALEDRLINLVSDYSTENFDIKGKRDYLFLAQYQRFLERSQGHCEELGYILDTLSTGTAPEFDALRKKMVSLLSEYEQKYQLVKFTAGLTFDKDFHQLIEKYLIPLNGLFTQVEQLKANRFLETYKRQVDELGRVFSNRGATVRIIVSKIKAGRADYKDYYSREITPLKTLMQQYRLRGFDFSGLARLHDIEVFAVPRNKVIKQQRNAFFKIMESVAASAVVTAGQDYSLKGRLVRWVAALEPSLNLADRVDRHYRTAMHKLESYNRLVRGNLMVLFDNDCPRDKMLSMLALDPLERRPLINQAMGDISLKYRESGKLAFDRAPIRGERLLNMSKRLVGLYIRELKQRAQRDSKLLSMLGRLKPVLQGLRNEHYLRSLRRFSHLAVGLSALIAPSKSGGLHFPHLDDEFGQDATLALEKFRDDVKIPVRLIFKKAMDKMDGLVQGLRTGGRGVGAAIKKASRVLGNPLGRDMVFLLKSLKKIGIEFRPEREKLREKKKALQKSLRLARSVLRSTAKTGIVNSSVARSVSPTPASTTSSTGSVSPTPASTTSARH